MDNGIVQQLLERTKQLADHADSATYEQLGEYMEWRNGVFRQLEQLEQAERVRELERFPIQTYSVWEQAIAEALKRCKREAQSKLLRFQQAKQQRAGYDMPALDTNSFFFDRKK
ncbi:MAG: hypothetical protein K0Q59_4550 [Paenibacillus sp.]|jgi:hypothetical protein|nr:hypothetical protein [Paenibacillus sp.]